ncbi:MAG: FtsW/RodA/SpoVE family cell cycle protein [Planctomycetota bacterium]
MIRSITRMVPLLGLMALIAALSLTAVGLLGVYASEAGGGSPATQTLRQSAYLMIGLAGFLFVQMVGYREIGRWAYPLFGLMLVLLVLLVVARKVPMEPLIEARRNAYRWITLGPISFQVSEYTKVVFILALAAYLRYRTNYRSLLGLFGPFVLTLIPLGLILREPDLGTSILLLPTLFVMLFAAGAKIKHLLLIVALGCAAAPAFYFSPLMNPYQRARIQSLFQQNEGDEHWRLNAGYQLNQSKIALGSGGVHGQGFREGAFFRHDLLPEEHNDFIFAVIGHQWGFVGCLFVLFCYFIIVAAGLTIASISTDAFGRLLAVGVSALIFAQTVINVGMTIGLMPITGMSLPFVSMGGSGLIASYLALGLLASVAKRQPPDIGPRPFEFGDEEDQG